MQPFDGLIAQRIQAALACFDPEERMPSAPPARACTVLVPIFNGAAQVRRCLASLLRNVGPENRIVLADDCSTDLSLGEELRSFAGQHENIEYLRRPSNLGYLDNVNAALQACTGDVVVLNSDTELAPEWLPRLQRAAYCAPNVALACPVSDNASLLSLAPVDWLADFSTEQIQAACAKSARAHFPRLPTAVGFCMYLRREALQALGYFDRFFAPGYGEEDDFAQRARFAGWQLVAAPDVFVRHTGGSSFGRGTQVSELQATHAARLSWRWPSFESDVRTWWRDWPLREHAERVRRALCEPRPAKPRVLHVLHRLTRIGGTEIVARGLVDALALQAEHTIVAVDPLPSIWADALEGSLPNGARTLMFNRENIQANHRIAGLPADLSDPALERSFARLLHGGQFDLVHVHHLAGWNSLLIPSIAHALGVPVVLGLHCHYALCPDPEMVRMPNDQPCDKPKALADQECQQCIGQRRAPRLGASETPMPLYLTARTAFWQRLFEDCRALIAPSAYLATRIGASFPEIGKRMHVIPHGLAEAELRFTPRGLLEPSAAKTLQVGFLGGDGAHKGFALIKQLAFKLEHLPIQLIAYGISLPDPNLPSNLSQRPAFAPRARARHLAGLDLILLPSQMAETFSLVLSEARALAIPVIAADRAVFIERIEHAVDGWRLDTRDVQAWATLLAELCTPDGKRALVAMRERLVQTRMITQQAQAQAYWAIYQSIWQQPRLAAAAQRSADPASERIMSCPPAASRLHPLEFVKPRKDRNKPQIVAIARDLWAQSQYRVQLPLSALARAGKIAEPAIWNSRHQAVPSVAELLRLEPDVVSFLHGLDSATLQLMRALHSATSRPRLVFLLDDLLTARENVPPTLADDLRAAVGLSDCVICTTQALATAVQAQTDLPSEKVSVIPNALPCSPWSLLARPLLRKSQPLRIVWAGASQHQRDLDLLIAVVAQTKHRYRWVFFGLCPTGMAADPLIEFHRPVEFANYPSQLISLNADIAVAPLQHTPFNRCKSALKLLEYGALGVPVVATDIAPYRGAPVLLANNTESWLAQLSALENVETRHARGLALQSWVRANHLLSAEQVQCAWLDALCKA